MAREPMRRGARSDQVARNIRALREGAGLEQSELADLVAALGHSISVNSISRLERGERRADPDDLCALALALGVSPNRLLLPGDADDQPVELAPTRTVTADDAWWWACGDRKLPGPDGRPIFGERDFPLVNRPHDPPDPTTIHEMNEWESELEPLYQEFLRTVRHRGVPPRIAIASISVLKHPTFGQLDDLGIIPPTSTAGSESS